MSMMKHSFLFISFFAGGFLQQVSSHISEPINVIPTQANSSDILRSFLKPVQFTRDGINTFFKTVFNSALYKDFLGSCFIHIDDFVVHGLEHEKPAPYYESVFMLFHHRIKENEWVNPYAFMLFLDQLPQRMQQILSLIETEQSFTAEFKKIIEQLPRTVDQDWYKKNAERLMQLSKADQEMKDLKRAITLFVESACNKLIWSPIEHEDIWNTVIVCSKKIERLYQTNCIEDVDALNRILWSLLYRLGYIIEVTGKQLPLSFFENIRIDIAKEMPHFLTVEEQETWVTTKKEYLDGVLTRAEIKHHITQQGVFGDTAQKT